MNSELFLFATTLQAMYSTELSVHGHQTRVWVDRIVNRLALSAEDTDVLFQAAVLHDIGKIFVPTTIVMKTGPLGNSELRAMRAHSELGGDLLSRFDREVARLVRAHHERWDGGGYPDGLKEEEIPYKARILVVADSIASMQENRIYQERLSIQGIINEIRKNSQTQFDPGIAEVALSVLKEDL